MKNILLLIIFLFGILSSGTGQNRSITFESKEWKKVVAKAKKENKLIFLDCHTSWCGPCKNLAKNIFTQDAVADFYNKNFVNLNLDMEKDVDGVRLSKVYKPTAFPTLLFIDPQTELVVHRVTGGGDVQYILSIAAEALNSDNTLVGSCNRYRKGDRSSEFVRRLMNDLKLAGAREIHREVSEAYFAGLNRQESESKENWELFKAHIDNPYAAIFQNVAGNRARYDLLFGEEEVAIALQWVVIMELGDIADCSKESGIPEAEARYQKLIALLNRIDFLGAPALLTDLYLSESLLRDCGDAWRVIQNGYQYNLTGDEYYRVPNVAVLYPLSAQIPSMGERIVLTELLSVVDRIRLRCSSMPYLARLALNRSLILGKLGDTKGADQAWTEYKQYCSMR